MCRDGSFHLVGDGHRQLGGIAKARKASAPKTVSNRRDCCSTPEPTSLMMSALDGD